jgi:hypothetical protein
MSRMKLTGAVFLALFALGAVSATAAQAEEAPYWSIEGTRLTAGKTTEIIAKGVSSAVFDIGPSDVTCTAGKLKAGAILIGSNAGEPGKTEGVTEFSGCTVTGNGSPCEVNNGTAGDLTTEPLTGELAYAENKKSLVGLTRAKKGKALVKAKFSGSGCTVLEAPVDGTIVGGIYTDVGGSAGVLLELPNPVTQAESFIVKSIGTSKTNVWIITGGTGAAVTTEEINYGGTEGSLEGETLGSLATNGVGNKKLWSPLL